jgi:urease accessory protein
MKDMPTTATGTDAASLIGLLTIASAALPVGGFVYSDGLETAVAAGDVCDEASLFAWIDDALSAGGARIEAAIVARVHAACEDRRPGDVARWDRELTALRDSEELRAQSRAMGGALVRLVRARPADAAPIEPYLPEGPLNYATAAACAFAGFGVARNAAVIAYLHALATHLVVAGSKLIPLGQSSAHRVLRDLAGPIARCAELVTDLSDESVFEQCAWGAALASMQHEVLYARIFKS